MRRIPKGEAVFTPVFVGGIGRGVRLFGVAIFAFGIDDAPKSSRLIDLFHRVDVVVENGGFEHGVFQAAVFLDGFVEFIGVARVSIEDGDGVADMLSVLKAEDCVTRVRGCVCRAKDRFDRIVFDHFFERGVCFLAFNGLGEFRASIGEEIGDGDDFDVWMILEFEFSGEFAKTVSDEPDAEFPVGVGLPNGTGVDLGVRLIESRNLFVGISGGGHEIRGHRRCGSGG